ncbi:protein Daple-like isoform X1 [Rhopilema esculentum]|uniref:protein Daple-like isoform X1 n=1 Tax=Rhopilema esculentum TaxID=499914 RepID=UPI0031E04DE1
MELNEEFFRNPLVVWAQDTFHDGKPFTSANEIVSSEFLAEVLKEIDLSTFNLLPIQENPQDLNIKVQNLLEVIRNVKRFYQEKLQILLLMKMPDILAIAKEPNHGSSLEEIKKFLLLILGCAVQCDKKEYFIEKITKMDFEVQTQLVPYIREITDNSDNAFSYRINEVSELSQDQLVTVTEAMYFQFQKILEERDEYFEAVLDMNLERHEMVAKEAELDLVKSPPMSPSRSGSIKTSVVLKANKQKIRDLQNELEERNMQVNEFKEEIASLKASLENIRQENKSLLSEARWVKTYRDEMDVLKSQVDKVNKLEIENSKYREKLRELDFYKKRFDELKEQHELLYETKLVLEEQVAGSSTKIERVGHLEEENDRLHAQLKIIMEERELNQVKAKELMDENAKLQMEKQESMFEVVQLNQIINGMKDRSPDGTAVPLSMEYKESSSTELLRLEKENKHLMKLVESLRDGNPKVRELEREMEKLEDSLHDEKAQVARLLEELSNGESILMELAFERSKAGELAGVAETHVNQIQRLKSRLSQRSMKVDDLNAALAKKGSAASKRPPSKDSDEWNNNLVDEMEDDDILSSKHFMELKNDIEEKQSLITVLEKKLQEAEQKSKKIDAQITQKKEEFVTLEARAKDNETYCAKVEQQLAEREKVIANLERRCESASTENKSLSQIKRLNEDKIAALEERVSHLMDSASQDTRKVNQTIDEKLRQIRELHIQVENLQEASHDNEKLKAVMKQRDEKISSLISSNKILEAQIHELELQCEKSAGTCKKLDHTLKLKNERINALEASLNESAKASAKLMEDKVVSLKKALESRNEEVADLETRVDEMASLNNKLKSSNRAKDDRIQSLEEEIAKLEERSSHSNGEKIEVLMKRLQKKADEIIHLENNLEDVTTAMKKQERSVEIKDEKIRKLEKELQKYEDSSQSAEKLSAALEEKNNKIYDLQAQIDDINAEVKRLEMTSKQKEERYVTLEKSLLELEDSKADQGKMSRIMKAKETKILSQQSIIDEQESRVVQLESLLDEREAQIKRINNSLKTKEEQMKQSEQRLSDCNDLQSQNSKLKNIVEQKEEKILLLMDKVDGMDELQRISDRMKENLKQKEDKIVNLQERIVDLEDVVNINERLNQQVHQKDERIAVLQAKVHDSEDSLHRAEQLRASLEKNANDEIQDLRRQVDELMDVKVKRQQSIRRREEKIMTLESRLEDVSSDTKHKESKIHDLQSRLEGTMSQFRKLDLSNEEKDEKIRDLESRVSELQQTYKENRNLASLVEQSAEKMKELSKRSEDAETAVARVKEGNRELETQLAGLQQRLEDTLNLNTKLDHHIKSKEEKLRDLENLLQTEEDKNEELNDSFVAKERLLTRQKTKIEELENAITAREKDVSDLEQMISQLSMNDENNGKSSAAVMEKEIVISNLQNQIRTLESSAAKQESLLLQSSKDTESRFDDYQKRMNDVSAEKHKMKLMLQEKDGVISDLQRRVEELQLSRTDHDKLNHILNEKNSQLSYLRETLEHYEKDIAHMETRIEGSNSDLNRAKGSIKQKVGRITSLKSQLEEAVSKNHNLASDLGLKKEKIASLERSLAEYRKKEQLLTEELSALAAELEEIKHKGDSGVVNVTEKVQLTKRARTELYIKRAPTAHQIYQFETHSSKQGLVSEPEVHALEEQIDLLQKEKRHMMRQSEEISAKNAALQTQNETLRSELDLLNSDYEVLQKDMEDAKEHYKDLDMSASKIAHRCEVLVQLNSTLEEENRALMDQVNKLLAQNQSLLEKTLESRDTYLEDERAFSDRLYMLERDREKLVDKLENANRTLYDMANSSKKRNLFVRGAHKVLKKAGLRKGQRKDDVVLKKLHRSPDGVDFFSDHSDSSFSSPSHELESRSQVLDESSLHSSSVTYNSSFGPIRSALSRSKEDLLGRDEPFSRDGVILRRPKSFAVDSPSSGSDNGERHMRPRSEYIAPFAEYHVSVHRNLHRPQSMEAISNLQRLDGLQRSDGPPRSDGLSRSDVSRTSSVGTHDGENPSISISTRKSSVNSNRSTGSNPSTTSGQNEVAFGVIGNRGDRVRNSPVQRVRVMRKVVAGGSPNSNVRSNTEKEVDDTDIVLYSEASQVQPRKISFQTELAKEVHGTHSTPIAEADERRVDANGLRNSPLVTRSSIFYQPTDPSRPDDLPEADQRTPRKNSEHLFQEEAAVASSPVGGQAPSYEEATRRQRVIRSQEVVLTPKRDSPAPNRVKEETPSKNDKVRGKDETEKKKSAVWYEYGRV